MAANGAVSGGGLRGRGSLAERNHWWQWDRTIRLSYCIKKGQFWPLVLVLVLIFGGLSSYRLGCSVLVGFLSYFLEGSLLNESTTKFASTFWG